MPTPDALLTDPAELAKANDHLTAVEAYLARAEAVKARVLALFAPPVPG